MEFSQFDKPEIEKICAVLRDYKQACILLSNDFPGSTFALLAGFSNEAAVTCAQPTPCFEKLQQELDSNRDYYFGHFAYDLKNETENLVSAQPDFSGFPLMSFFRPEILLKQIDGEMRVSAKNSHAEKYFFDQLARWDKPHEQVGNESVILSERTSREEYLATVKKILAHIHRGDIYEMNYCIEFFAENVRIDPPALFSKLNSRSQAPFSALYKNGDSWLICASPERFLKKEGNHLISQPIKGTRARGKTKIEDEQLKEELFSDAKEQSENVMIVDLVRNDLSKSAAINSVKVDELFGIYSFNTVHQMISTISAELRENVHPVDAIRHAFPMGSMTGAPKVSAMQLAEKSEQMRRGIYSGAVGYFTPGMNFDFNVVIRSIEYNAATGYLSFKAGSAITANSDPEKEYEECLLKAKSMMEAIGVETRNHIF